MIKKPEIIFENEKSNVLSVENLPIDISDQLLKFVLK